MKSRINEVMEFYREFFATHSYKDTPMLTAYVNIDTTDPANQRERPAWLIELKNEWKRIDAELDPEELKRYDALEKWARADDMVMAHLQDRKPTGRSVVLFSDLSDFIAVDLPVPVTTRLFYGLPQVKHLLFMLDQFKKYLVVLLSGVEVRLLEVFLTRTTDEVRVETEHELERRLGRKANIHGRERRYEEYERRFIRDVATGINEYFLADPDFERLVFGGNFKQAHAVKNALHPAVRETLVAIEPIDFTLANNEVAQQLRAVAARYELEHDLAVVEDLVTRYNRGGTAVLERQGVEQALARGNVNTLVIPYPIDAEKFDSLIVDATVGGAEIEFVFDEAANRLNEFGGIGATLYYSGG